MTKVRIQLKFIWYRTFFIPDIRPRNFYSMHACIIRERKLCSMPFLNMVIFKKTRKCFVVNFPAKFRVGLTCVLHHLFPAISLITPSQSRPFTDGLGLVQVLVLNWTPPPHALVHCPADDQTDQPPLITVILEITVLIYNIT